MNNSPELVLNSPLRKPINLKSVDGKSIVNALQYQLLVNLNLTLIEYESDTNLVTLLAEDYDIKENRIIFKIRKGVRTISGHEIKGIDAEVSLKRLIFSKGNHSKLSELLCAENYKDCPGIKSNNFELVLTAKKKSYIPFILKLLTNADNVILPITALSSTLPDSEIINFTETTGPYYISSPIKNHDVSNIKLEINPKHFLYNKEMAREVNYKQVSYEKLISPENLLNSDFNYIHNVTNLNPGQMKVLREKESNVNVFATAPIKNTMIFSTTIGRSKLSLQVLAYHSLIIRNTLLSSESFKPNIDFPQIEFFPQGGDGHLENEELAQVIQFYSNILEKKSISKSKIKLGVFEASYDDYVKILTDLKDIEVVKIKNSPFEANDEKVDIFIDTVDSSFMETLDLLEFNKSLEIFNVSDAEMKLYIDSEDKSKRIEILRKIHLKSLLEVRFVNIGSSPYYTVLSKKWSANPSTYFVGFPVWKIRIKSF